MGKKKEYSSLILQKKNKCWYFIRCLLNDTHGGLGDGTPQKHKNTFPLQQAFGFVQRAFIIIRNVIALLLLKDRGRGWGGWIRLRDIKYVLSINAEPTSSLYISTPACDFLTWWSYYIPLTPCMSYVSEHNHCCSLLHPKVEMSINTRLGLYGRTRLITEVSDSA